MHSAVYEFFRDQGSISVLTFFGGQLEQQSAE